jgi:hypothetical protein
MQSEGFPREQVCQICKRSITDPGGVGRSAIFWGVVVREQFPFVVPVRCWIELKHNTCTLLQVLDFSGVGIGFQPKASLCQPDPGLT